MSKQQPASREPSAHGQLVLHALAKCEFEDGERPVAEKRIHHAVGLDKYDLTHATIADLTPQYMQKLADSSYTITIDGVLRTNWCSRASRFLEELLWFLRRKFEDDASFKGWTWKELRDSALCESGDFHMAASLITLADLSGGGGGARGDDKWFWRIPEDLLALMRLRTFGEWRQYNDTLLSTRNKHVEGRLVEEWKQRITACVEDPILRGIVVRDYEEVQKCLNCGAWKAAIILCGGALEGLLLARIARSQVDHATKDLDSMIRYAASKKWIGPKNIHDSLRNYRNLVHPGKELEQEYKVDRPEAQLAASILDITIRDLHAEACRSEARGADPETNHA